MAAGRFAPSLRGDLPRIAQNGVAEALRIELASLDKLDDLAKIHEAAIFAGFDAEDVERLESLLDAISRNLSDLRSQRVVAK